jgi:cell division protein FtsN
MRQGWWHWRIVSIAQEGRPLLLSPSPQPEQTAAVAEHLDDVPVNGIVTEPPADLPLEEPVAEAETPEPARVEPAPMPRLAPMVAAVAEAPAPEQSADARAHWTPGGRPFVRRLDGASWTVQVGSSTDALAAAVQRDRFASRGEAAIVQPVTVRGTQWHRVLVGSFPTKREADQVATRLGAGVAN